MNENPLNLTDEQITAVLDLRSKDLDRATIREDALAELVRLGIVDRRKDGTIDFTDAGEKIHDALVRQAA